MQPGGLGNSLPSLKNLTLICAGFPDIQGMKRLGNVATMEQFFSGSIQNLVLSIVGVLQMSHFRFLYDITFC